MRRTATPHRWTEHPDRLLDTVIDDHTRSAVAKQRDLIDGPPISMPVLVFAVASGLLLVAAIAMLVRGG